MACTCEWCSRASEHAERMLDMVDAELEGTNAMGVRVVNVLASATSKIEEYMDDAGDGDQDVLGALKCAATTYSRALALWPRVETHERKRMAAWLLKREDARATQAADIMSPSGPSGADGTADGRPAKRPRTE